jgi:hypothetical protein
MFTQNDNINLENMFFLFLRQNYSVENHFEIGVFFFFCEFFFSKSKRNLYFCEFILLINFRVKKLKKNSNFPILGKIGPLKTFGLFMQMTNFCEF